MAALASARVSLAGTSTQYGIQLTSHHLSSAQVCLLMHPSMCEVAGHTHKCSGEQGLRCSLLVLISTDLTGESLLVLPSNCVTRVRAEQMFLLSPAIPF